MNLLTGINSISNILWDLNGVLLDDEPVHEQCFRELLSNDVSVNNLDEARFTDKVDPVDSLRRIGKAWHAIGLTCRCHSNQACNICEIYYLLEEAFEPPKSAE